MGERRVTHEPIDALTLALHLFDMIRNHPSGEVAVVLEGKDGDVSLKVVKWEMPE